MSKADRAIAIAWQISDTTGWGLVGLQTSLALMAMGRSVYWLERADPMLAQSRYCDVIQPLLDMQQRFEKQAATMPDEMIHLPDAAVLHPATHHFNRGGNRYRGDWNLALIPAEKTAWPEDQVAAAKARYDALLAPSRWALEALNRAGIDHAALWHQAMDCALFQPMMVDKLFPNRFVVYASGKLELRKGQDIIVEAFKRFHQRHPEALLLTNWQSAWPKISADIARSTWVDVAADPFGQGSIDIAKWGRDVGLPEGSHADIGWRHNAELPSFLNQADIYVSASRCEGATNFGVMEAMACALPVILPAHSGHLDLINDAGDNVYAYDGGPLSDLGQGDAPAWHEPSPDALLAAMEQAYDNEQTRRQTGKRARKTMQQDWTWAAKTGDLLAVIDALP